MATDTVEFDILANGKPAINELDKVDKKLDDVDKTNTETTKRMKMNWVAVGASIAAAGVALGAAANKALELERATFGLTDATKAYIKQASIQHGMSQEMIAGFVQTGKSAGMSGREIEKMIDQAVALGRKFPHESTETFIDNLSMLNRTGEAQGFIVDVLETKYGTLDLKTLSLADKMAAVEEATSGVNAEFGKTTASKVDSSIQKVTNSITDLGSSLLTMLDSSGALYLFDKAIGAVSLSMNGLAMTAKQAKIWVKGVFGADTAEDIQEFNKLLKDNEDIWNDIAEGRSKKQLDAPKITGIEGRAKAQTQLEMEMETSRLKELESIRKKDQRNKEADEKRLLREKERAEKEHLKEIQNIRESFSDDYLQSITDDTEYEIVKLAEQYAEYEKTIQDKDKLNEWYNNRVEEIVEKAGEAERKEAEKVAKQMETVFNDAFGGMEDSLSDMVKTGKMDFNSLIDSIVEGLIRMQVRKSITQPLMGAFTAGGGMGGLFGSLFAHAGKVGVHHAGLIPSHHNGSMRSDERLAKLQVGESVVNRHATSKNKGALEAMNRGESIGTPSIILNIENNTGSEIQEETSTTFDGKSLIINTMLGAINNNGTMRNAIKGVK